MLSFNQEPHETLGLKISPFMQYLSYVSACNDARKSRTSIMILVPYVTILPFYINENTYFKRALTPICYYLQFFFKS